MNLFQRLALPFLAALLLIFGLSQPALVLAEPADQLAAPSDATVARQNAYNLDKASTQLETMLQKLEDHFKNTGAKIQKLERIEEDEKDVLLQKIDGYINQIEGIRQEVRRAPDYDSLKTIADRVHHLIGAAKSDVINHMGRRLQIRIEHFETGGQKFISNAEESVKRLQGRGMMGGAVRDAGQDVSQLEQTMIECRNSLEENNKILRAAKAKFAQARGTNGDNDEGRQMMQAGIKNMREAGAAFMSSNHPCSQLVQSMRMKRFSR